jgi:hypothetical protein
VWPHERGKIKHTTHVLPSGDTCCEAPTLSRDERINQLSNKKKNSAAFKKKTKSAGAAVGRESSFRSADSFSWALWRGAQRGEASQV